MSYEIDRQLGHLLRHHRTRIGLSIAELAQRTAMAREDVVKLEAGRGMFDRHTLMSVSEAIDIPVIAFLGNDGQTGLDMLNRHDRVSAAMAGQLFSDFRSLENSKLFNAICRALGLDGNRST